jgi:8-oxo-dGTP diphosphatase
MSFVTKYGSAVIVGDERPLAEDFKPTGSGPRKYIYDYPRPAVTVDVAAFRVSADRRLEVLLIQRGKEPCLGSWALPGGHVEHNEDLAPAASREFNEETGLYVPHNRLRQVGAFGAPGRDSRGHYITIAYTTWLSMDDEPTAGDDAAKAQWFDIYRLPALAFDHALVIDEGLISLGTR